MQETREKILSLTSKDFAITTFRTGGPGGQKQNKTSSGVRISHKESGCSAESRNSRSQHSNKKEAFSRLVAQDKFKKWIKLEINRKLGYLDKIEKEVEDSMTEENILVEVIGEDNKWHKEDEKEE
jgi:AAA15 family ATPase/GTPase